MPAHQEVSDSEIIEAGTSLRKAGKPITGSSLRGQLGRGRGTRLAQVWEAYLAREEATSQAAVSAFPPALEEVRRAGLNKLEALATSLLQAAWGHAEAFTERTLSEQTSGLSDRIRSLEAELQQTELQLEERDATNLCLTTGQAELASQLTSLSSDLAQERGRQSVMQEEASRTAERLNLALHQAATYQARLEAAEAARTDELGKSAAAQRTLDETRLSLARAEARIEALEETLLRTEASNRLAIEEQAQLRERLHKTPAR